MSTRDCRAPSQGLSERMPRAGSGRHIANDVPLDGKSDEGGASVT
jgi:hypothetical protein